MNTLNIYRLMALLTMVVGLAVIESQTAVAAFDESQSAVAAFDELVLTAHLQGKFQGEAIYTQNGKKLAFHAAVKGAPPDVQLVVAIRTNRIHQKIATMRTDKRGFGTVTISSDRHSIPQMREKDMIEIWLGNNVGAKGFLSRFK